MCDEGCQNRRHDAIVSARPNIKGEKPILVASDGIGFCEFLAHLRKSIPSRGCSAASSDQHLIEQ